MASLGFWNRLALVVFCGALIAIPPIIYIDMVSGVMDLADDMRDLCMKAAENDYAATDRCWDDYKRNRPNIPFWPFWREAIPATAIGGAVVYVLIWLCAALTKWVWAGRKNIS